MHQRRVMRALACYTTAIKSAAAAALRRSQSPCALVVLGAEPGFETGAEWGLG